MNEVKGGRNQHEHIHQSAQITFASKSVNESPRNGKRAEFHQAENDLVKLDAADAHQLGADNDHRKMDFAEHEQERQYEYEKHILPGKSSPELLELRAFNLIVYFY